MSRDEKGLSSDWLQQRLEALRRQLEQGELSQEMQKLFDDLAPAVDAEPIGSENEAMFSLALDAALKGIDVSKRYPTFFRHLLSDPRARRDFLDALEILQKSEKGDLEPLSGPPGAELSFLEQRDDPRPTVEMTAPAQWQVTWQRAQDYLQSLFSSYFTAPGYRESSSLLEDAHLVLIDDLVTVDDVEFTVLLGATRHVETPGSLTPSLMVTGEPDRSLWATLAWGAYQETIPVENNNLVTFPFVSLDAIAKEGDPSDVADLQLTLKITMP